MVRIVAGRVGGRRLHVPPSGTRPTSERVREALFSSLSAAGTLEGARVLDLYAGSGALGLEAASRGASHVVLVESDRRAAATAARNVRDLGLDDIVRVSTATVRAHVATTPEAPHDLVFADPPYDAGDDELADVLSMLVRGWLTPGATVVVERSRRSAEPAWPEGLVPGRPRRYGDTTLHLASTP